MIAPSHKFQTFQSQLLSIIMLIVTWFIVSAMASVDVLPSPMAVGTRIYEELIAGELIEHVGATLLRVISAFVIAMVIGTVIGIALGMRKKLGSFFNAWLLFFLNMPALVVIILCYLWIGLNEVACIVAVAINKIPNVAVTVREGAKNLDRDLLEMGQVYRLSWRKRMFQIVWPQLNPFIAASARTGLALIWKIVLVVELLGRSDGVGFQLHLFFQLFDVTGILAYSLSFMCVIALIEYGLIGPWERHVNRWKKS